MAITTVKDLRYHLQCAIGVEHSTLPPYLCALYSLKDQDSEASKTIRSVAMEEMLHAMLGANLLNAIGGKPRFDDPHFIPAYPGPLPHHDPHPPVMLHLEPCSVELLRDTFMAIERPETPGAPAQDDNYTSLGQFYKAVEYGFEGLTKELGEDKLFCGDPALQIQSGYWGGGGQLVVVRDLATAQRAIEEIVEQGEGTSQSEYDPEGELAHYWKFKTLVDDPSSLGTVYPMAKDPKAQSLPAGPLRRLSQLFNDCYGLLLRKLTAVVGGQPDQILTAVQLMQNVLRPVAVLLMQTPLQPGYPERGNAGPSFEYSTTGQEEIVGNAKDLESTYPELEPVSQTLEKLPLFDQG